MEQRLESDRPGAEPAPPPRRPEPAIDTRPYRWMIGVLGLILLIAFSVLLFATRGLQTPGVAAGQRLHLFVAPLASSPLQGDANLSPRCDPAHPNPEALNVCARTPTVLALFATSSSQCTRAVDALQALSRRFSPRVLQLGAVAVQSSYRDAAALVRAHHWTVPVAYDRDGAIAALYGVSVCPIIELAYRGGTVAQRLIGDRWTRPGALDGPVRSLLAHSGR